MPDLYGCSPGGEPRCWEEAYFEKEVYFGCRPILRRNSILGTCLFLEKDLFWERPIFGKEDLILEHAQQVERKKYAKKEGKTTCRGKRNMAHRKKILTMIGLGFLDNIVTTITR
jgi:hypothetical protein